jgi:hypothetical protein
VSNPAIFTLDLAGGALGRSIGLAYLATPYTKYPLGIERAFIDAAALAAQLMRACVKVYSPIAHTHPLAVHGHIDPLDHAIWLPFDEAMMAAADVLIVARMEGWRESKGIAHEVEFFERAGKPIFDLDPGSLILMRRRAEVSARAIGAWMADDAVRHGDAIDEPDGNAPLAHGKTRSQQGGSSA